MSRREQRRQAKAARLGEEVHLWPISALLILDLSVLLISLRLRALNCAQI
ncbi:MAG: hypothetical protein HY400_06400 [Elusimicrobia bacterium]|nr:hypothetical protein [Elusimicrobiota bacterium]